MTASELKNTSRTVERKLSISVLVVVVYPLYCSNQSKSYELMELK